MKATAFDKLVSTFLATDQLGHYNPDDHSIMLYGIPNNPATISKVKQTIAAITTRCKVIILDPQEDHTNINIIDIDL